MRITLIGMAGSGKSFIGRKVAGILGVPWFDLNRMIEAEKGEPLQKFLAAVGDEKFVEVEAEFAERVVRETESAVISTGGSLVYSSTAMRTLRKNSIIVYLRVPFETIAARVQEEGRGIVFHGVSRCGSCTIGARFSMRSGLTERLRLRMRTL